VKLLREKGMGIKQIAKELQIGIGTVYWVISVYDASHMPEVLVV